MEQMKAHIRAVLLGLAEYGYKFHLVESGGDAAGQPIDEIVSQLPLTDFDIIEILETDSDEGGVLFLVFDVDEPEQVIADYAGSPAVMRAIDAVLDGSESDD